MNRHTVAEAIRAARRNSFTDLAWFVGAIKPDFTKADDAIDYFRRYGHYAFAVDASGEVGLAAHIEFLAQMGEAPHELAPWSICVISEQARVVVVSENEQDAIYMRLCHK